MVNTILSLHEPFLHVLMKLSGIELKRIEIQPATIINIWVPIEKKSPKPAVVFLHGFAADGINTWQFQILALAKKYSIYVPDFVFFGGSITDKSDRTAEFQADCMAKCLTKLGVEKCTIVGFSYGGMVGFKMAEKYPDLVQSLVISCSVVALNESISSAGLKRIGFKSWPDFLLPQSVNGVKMMLDVATYKLPWLPQFFYKDFLEAFFDNRQERVELLEALVVRDKDFYVPKYPQRIHLLCGASDVIFDKETIQNMKDEIGAKASMEFIEKAGHLVQLERPCIYNRKLEKFLASLSLAEEHAHTKIN